MKRILLLAVLLAIALSAIVATATAPLASADSPVTRAIVHGPGAHARWNLGDNATYIKWVTVDVWRSGGIGTEGPLGRHTGIDINVYEGGWNPYYNKGVYLSRDLKGWLYETKGPGLDSGSLVGPLPVDGVWGYPSLDSIDVDLTWTGTGDITVAKGREVDEYSDGKLYQCFWNVKQRNAVVSGTIRIGDEVVTLEPGTMEYGYLEYADPSGCVIVQ